MLKAFKIVQRKVLENQNWSVGVLKKTDIHQIGNVRSSFQSLQDLNFPFNFGFTNRFKNLQNHELFSGVVDSLINLRIFSSSNFFNQLKAFQIAY